MSVETTVAVAKPVINLRLFTIRIITAVSLFAVLGKANVWLDTATNSILALGYRALLLLLPLTLLVLGRRSLSVRKPLIGQLRVSVAGALTSSGRSVPAGSASA